MGAQVQMENAEKIRKVKRIWGFLNFLSLGR